ncbi:MAG: hypothetical protein NZ898_11925 [Myxococcota bacterium]|nr:hypothetical protein [Myxococcota bacterium]MDW8363394.1 hypothetical protein [Myxococcales bacterium]
MLDPRRVIFRWDLDKTYLRTEFDTLRDLVRTAFEPAVRKQTVPGAASLLRAVRDAGPAGIHILSGSPEQMRRVLEQKLRLDGVHWDSFTLKPSLAKLLRGRFRFVRDQVGYKLGALLEARAAADPDTVEMLFGDDAESDAFVYSLYADLCAGRVGPETLRAVLERARVHTAEIPRIERAASRLPRGEAVRRIFIHLDRGSDPSVFAELGPRVCPFWNYFQPAAVLVDEGVLEPQAALRVAADLVLAYGFGADGLLASVADLARRGQLGERATSALAAAQEAARSFGPAASVIATFQHALGRERHSVPPPAPRDVPPIDYVGFFSRDRARAREARRRSMLRRELG